MKKKFEVLVFPSGYLYPEEYTILHNAFIAFLEKGIEISELVAEDLRTFPVPGLGVGVEFAITSFTLPKNKPPSPQKPRLVS